MLDESEPKDTIAIEMLNDMSQKMQTMATDFIGSQFNGGNHPGSALMKDLSQLYTSWLQQPQALLNIQQSFWADYFKLVSQSVENLYGIDSEPVIEVAKGDRRFKSESWDENPWFNFIKQQYLLVSQCVLACFSVSEGLDEKTAKKLQFMANQWLDAMSPSNFAMTNPDVLQRTLDSNGENLLNGFTAMLEDLQRGKGERLLTRMTDFSAFEIGKNVATTPGKVIFQNDVFQLIQYTPTTKKVYETPLLIIPPWINKYYILDLREENSFIKYAVDQGHSVFIISWINPEREQANKTFEDYMQQGVITALETVKKETGASSINTIGYCIGGTMLAATNAWLTSKCKKIN